MVLFVHLKTINIFFSVLHGRFAAENLFTKINIVMTFNTVKRSVSFAMLASALFLASCEKSVTTEELVGNWKRRAEFDGNGRIEAVTFTIGDKIYAGGGYNGTRLQDFWVFNQTTNTWVGIAPFPGTARNSAVAFA